MVVFLPLLSTTCYRCTHNYWIELIACPHCTGLSGVELERLIANKNETLDANRPLGWFFALIAATIVVFLVKFNLGL